MFNFSFAKKSMVINRQQPQNVTHTQETDNVNQCTHSTGNDPMTEDEGDTKFDFKDCKTELENLERSRKRRRVDKSYLSEFQDQMECPWIYRSSIQKFVDIALDNYSTLCPEMKKRLGTCPFPVNQQDTEETLQYKFKWASKIIILSQFEICIHEATMEQMQPDKLSYMMKMLNNI